MTTISAKMIADSISPTGHRLTTLELRYPRCIHSEFMTHRVFSRNSASSRAIPVKSMIESIRRDPFVPLVWGKNMRGMQGGEDCDEMIESPGYLEDVDIPITRKDAWLRAMNQAIEWAEAFADAGYHKQIVNRLLEPWMHITVCVSSTTWTNFLALRDHDAAEPHMRMLARAIGAALRGSLPRTVGVGGWHLPYVTEDERKGWRTTGQSEAARNMDHGEPGSDPETQKLLAHISAARCARTSYLLHDGERPQMADDIGLYERLAKDRPMHASPLEHQATPDDYTGKVMAMRWQNREQWGNFYGWRQFRKMHEGESQ